jgi:hypothetical protein
MRGAVRATARIVAERVRGAETESPPRIAPEEGFRKLEAARPRGRGTLPQSAGRPAGAVQSSIGWISCAKLLRARLSRLLTVPRLTPVMSEISS